MGSTKALWAMSVRERQRRERERQRSFSVKIFEYDCGSLSTAPSVIELNPGGSSWMTQTALGLPPAGFLNSCDSSAAFAPKVLSIFQPLFPMT
jgi:hypothetical protein